MPLRALLSVALLVPRLVAAQLPAASAQEPVGRIAVIVDQGRVHLYPNRVPSDGEGWMIRRDGTLLTRTPMTGVQGPAEFAEIVGPDLALIQRITATDNSLAAFRRLRAGGTAAGIAQILSPRAAAALGSLFVDSTVAAGSLHEYTAELVRLARPDSALRRARATVRVVPTVVPAPGAPRARTTDGRVTLTWTPPRFTGASDDPVVAYVVERADSVGEFARLTALPVMRLADQPSGHEDETAIPGTFYRYRLRAADLLGRLSPPGPVVTARAPGERGPMPPNAVAADVTDGRIHVVWTIAPEPTTRGYQVERSVGGDSTFTRVTRTLIPVDAPEWTDTLVRGREVYAYRVRAVDARGRVGAPSNPTTTRALDLRPPAVPTGLTATLLPGRRVRIAWRAVGDRDLQGYEVSRAEERDSSFARITANPQRATVYTDTGYTGNTLEPGREYRWRITAVDSSANGSAFAEIAFRLPDDEAPDPARSILVHNQLGRWVEITWTPSPSQDVVRYVVERTQGTAAPVVVATLGARASLAARDTTVAKGRVARWAVIAVDSAGNRSTALADTVTFRDLTKPPAPRRVTAVRVNGVTTVRWERVVSTDFRGYVVYRAERTDGPRTKLTATPVTALEFIDRAGTPTMRYFIRAVDASGNESDESPVAVTVERPR